MIINEVIAALEDAVGPVVKILQKSENIKVIVLGLKKGMILKAHKTNLKTKLLVVEGCVVYKMHGNATTLNKFDDLDIPVNELHSVEAADDSICLLMQG